MGLRIRFPNRILRVLLLLTLFGLAFGQTAAAFEVGAGALESCAQSCPGEEPGAPCDPLCDFCTCCSLAPQVTTPVASGAPVIRSLPHDVPQEAPLLSAEPSDILHVPRSLLA